MHTKYIVLKSLVQKKMFFKFIPGTSHSNVEKNISRHAQYYINKSLNNFILTFLNYLYTLPFHAMKRNKVLKKYQLFRDSNPVKNIRHDFHIF